MANPTFDGTALTTDASAERIGTPDARVTAEALPDVKGQFVQAGCPGGRNIIVTGIYAGTPSAAIADAQAALKNALRAVQAKVGSGVRAYVGVDGHTYSACVLQSFQAVGGLRHVRAGGNYQAVVRVRAVIRDLDP